MIAILVAFKVVATAKHCRISIVGENENVNKEKLIF